MMSEIVYSAEDDLPHPVGDDPNWNESYYFFWADSRTEFAGFSRIGVRGNRGVVEGLHGLFLGGSRIGFFHTSRPIEEGGEGLFAGPLAFDCLEPMQKWRLRYRGEIQDIDDGSLMTIPRKQRPSNWYSANQVDMDLQFTDASKPYGFSVHGADNHFELFGQVCGTLKVGDLVQDIAGFGIRDKSWGPRSWAAPFSTDFPRAEGQPATFCKWPVLVGGPDMSFAQSIWVNPEGQHLGKTDGLALLDGSYTGMKDTRVRSTYRENSFLHNTVTLSATIEDQHAEFSGTVINHIPTKIPMPDGKTITYITEGLVSWTLPDGRKAPGIAEYHVAVPR